MAQESEHLEFKREFVDDIKYTVIAFANTSGGRLWIGVEDDASVCGVSNPDETMLRLTNAIRDAIRPDVTLFTRCQTIQMDGKNVVEVCVQRGTSRPYYLAGKGIRPEGVYIRQGASSVPASETVILNMIRESSGECYEEAVALRQDLTFQKTDAYFRQKKIAFGKAQKRSLKLINADDQFTNLAFLLSDQCTHTIKMAVFDGSTKTVFMDRDETSGALLEQIQSCYAFIDRHNPRHSSFSGLERIDDRAYPVEAIREALLNSIVHRKYELTAPTLISIFDDRMEFVTVGGLPTGIQPDDLGLGVSVLRNRNLGEVFYRLHLIEAYGTGLMKINECYANARVKPKIDISSNAFKITLPNLHYKADSPRTESPTVIREPSPRDRILALLQTQSSITRQDIENALHISQTMAINLVRAMTEKGILVRIGTGKNTRYCMNTQEPTVH